MDAFFATAQTASYNIVIGGLTSATLYKWIARCRYGSVSAFRPLRNFTTSAEKVSHNRVLNSTFNQTL